MYVNEHSLTLAIADNKFRQSKVLQTLLVTRKYWVFSLKTLFGRWLLGNLLCINKQNCCLSIFSRCSLLLAQMYKWTSYPLISLISSTYQSNTIWHLVNDRTYYSELSWEYCFTVAMSFALWLAWTTDVIVFDKNCSEL